MKTNSLWLPLFGGLLVGNIVLLFVLEQAASYRGFYPNPWRLYHLAATVELAEIAIAVYVGRCGFKPSTLVAWATLGCLIFSSIYFSALHIQTRLEGQGVAIRTKADQKANLDRQIRRLEIDLAYYKTEGQRTNVSLTSRELVKSTNRLDQLLSQPSPARQKTSLDNQIVNLFILRLSLKFAGLILSVLFGQSLRRLSPLNSAGEPQEQIAQTEDAENAPSPLTSPVGPVRGTDGRFTKQPTKQGEA